MSEQRFIFFQRTERNSHLDVRAHSETVNDVDLRLRAPRLHVQGDINLMPVLGGTQMLSKGLRTSMKKRSML
jgi:hypothetical protein